MRDRAKFFASVSLCLITSFVIFVIGIREWHAWRGHKSFTERQFAQAANHLAYVGDGPTFYGQAFAPLLSFKYLRAQSSLILGRDDDALQHFRELAALNPGDPTPHLIVSISRWMAGDLSGAAANCEICQEAHEAFRAAIVAEPKIAPALAAQEHSLTSIKLPAQCVSYRIGTTSVRAVIAFVVGYFHAGAAHMLKNSGLSKAATKQAIDLAAQVLSRTLKDAFDRMAGLASHLEANCSSKVEFHELLRDLPAFRTIDEWIELKKIEIFVDEHLYLREAKELMAVRAEIAELTRLSLAYFAAYKTEADARQTVLAAHEFARATSARVRREAEDVAFSSNFPKARQKSWLESMKSLWPF